MDQNYAFRSLGIWDCIQNKTPMTIDEIINRCRELEIGMIEKGIVQYIRDNGLENSDKQYIIKRCTINEHADDRDVTEYILHYKKYGGYMLVEVKDGE